MRAIRVLLWCLAATALAADPAGAWWAEGHARIDGAAALVLPEDMPEFFRRGADRITSYSMDPDLWRAPELPALRSAEGGNHFLDLELLKGRELPPTRREYHALCRELEVDPFLVGTLSYSIQEWHDRLAFAFREHRARPDDEAVRAEVLYIAGVLSHYTGDASQPLHCTVHYDGRAGADGSSPKTGVHAQMDALPGRLRLEPAVIAEGLKIKAPEDVFAFAVTAIRESNRRVDLVYRLEDELPPAEGPLEGGPDERVVELGRNCCAAGAELTATVWYSAWLKSADISLPAW